MSANKPHNPTLDRDFLRSFGRRKGRALPEYKQELLDELMPKLFPVLDEDRETWLEIGFGGGEHLLELAKNYPERHIIGAEPYLNGIAKLLTELAETSITNLSVIPDDVRPWLKTLPEASLDGVYLLFPDPWPKTSHHKRRILNTALLDLIAKVLKPHGVLRIATDHVDYSAWMMEHLLPHPSFKWKVESHKDWHEPFSDWKQTRYQQKTTQQGRLPIFLEFALT
ncbi:MAG: tRNA (guanosine(46)-N7)-methyltransferase TrmB [Rickettsiales bacterium]|nr:tRNA (guanosine(46)-N7)-methyltransferase TrmB [Rickettsiales bacterium]